MIVFTFAIVLTIKDNSIMRKKFLALRAIGNMAIYSLALIWVLIDGEWYWIEGVM